jgi:hypothetical protein
MSKPSPEQLDEVFAGLVPNGSDFLLDLSPVCSDTRPFAEDRRAR